MPVPNTHTLVSQYETFLLLCILQIREERKKRQRCHMVLICTEEGMRVEKLPWLHVTMSYLRFGLESERNCFQEHLHPVEIMEITECCLVAQ